ncbi:MAG TPA: UbiA family prenyltransferase, partial [Phycisphaeraceae bacterium]
MTTLPRRLVLVARDIKLSHSVFALPFALLAAFLAAGSAGRLPGAATLALIVLCMVLARTVAMTVNRWADASFDAANPRTAKRAIPRGDLSGQFMLRTAIACALGFLVATSGFWLLDDNPWPMLLAPLV